MPPINDPNVLVGKDTSDDAAVYRLNDDVALVQTVDFFAPVVDDPFAYGSIAVANALSDIYAMGAHPIIALNIVSFPKDHDMDVLSEIIKGGAAKATEAGVLILGGHSVDDAEPKYGLSVTGLVAPGHEVTNAGAQVGDALIITKPIGMGILTTALKVGRLEDNLIEKMVSIMSTLNRPASEAMLEVGVNACTDITGFGLLGHLQEMLNASGVGARIRMGEIPILPEVWGQLEDGVIPDGTFRNIKFIENKITLHHELDLDDQAILCDPQTSGGLLISVSEDMAPTLLDALEKRDVNGTHIGYITEDPKLIVDL